MIEIPAAALTLKIFLKYFDFLSIGTNDLIQYTLAIDRADESVAHLYDPLHPAVLRLVADTIAECNAQGKGVSVCGEMAGDISLTRLLLGLGLRSFSMHPAQILAVKQEVLRADAARLAPWAQQVLEAEDPAALLAGWARSVRACAEHGGADDQRRGSRDAPGQRPAADQHQQQRRSQRRDVAQDADVARITQLERLVPEEESRAQRAQAHDGDQRPVPRVQRRRGLERPMAQQRQHAGHEAEQADRRGRKSCALAGSAANSSPR